MNRFAKEEPKGFWFIDIFGIVEYAHLECYNDVQIAYLKRIGNYFLSREEAEEAVRKLQAWKRLKDKGFINKQVFIMNLNWCDPDDDDWEAFHVLFGGEE